MNVRLFFIFLCSWCLLVPAAGSMLGAQTSVFPGDANNNGRVDHYDVLPIGYAFGQFGPSRVDIESSSLPQGVFQTWSQDFTTGVNYIHADANGDGLVSMPDLALVSNNFGLELDSVYPLEYSSTDNPTAARVLLNEGVELPPFVEGTTVDIPLRFALPDGDPTLINGLAFTLSYTAAHFDEVQLLLNPGWILADGGGTSFVRYDTGKLHLALTRFGPNPVGGSGDIGIIRMIIIDDVITLLETPADTLQSDVLVADIQAYDGAFDLVPVLCPEFALRMYCEDSHTGVGEPYANPLGAVVFPNPVAQQLHLSSTEPFSAVELIDLKGRRRLLYQGDARRKWQCEDIACPPGLYILRLYGEQGTSTLKLIRN